MALRGVLDRRLCMWGAIGAAILVVVHARLPWLLGGRWLVLTLCLLVTLVFVLHHLWRLPIAVTMCIALVLTIFSGNWGSLGFPGFPFLPDRLLIVMVLLALLFGSPGTRGRPAIRVRPVHLLLAVLSFYALASAAGAGTLLTKSGAFDLLDRLGIVPFAMLLLAPVIFAGHRERQMLLVTLVGLGAYLSLTAVFESLGPHALVFPHYIVTTDAALPGERAGGPFRSSVTEGFATFACAVAAVIAYSQWAGERKRFFAAGVGAVSVLACFLTLERGVWIAAAAGAIGAVLATGNARRWLPLGVLGCALLVGGALTLSPDLASKASARANAQRSVWDRQNQTTAGIRMVQAKPLFGFGWDRYEAEALPYFRQSSSYPMSGYPAGETNLPLHDIYLSNAVELGFLGAFMWLVALLWGLGGAIFARGPAQLRPWKLGLLAITICFLVLAFVDPLQQNFTELLLWTWAGVALGSGAAASRAPARAPSRGEAAPSLA